MKAFLLYDDLKIAMEMIMIVRTTFFINKYVLFPNYYDEQHEENDKSNSPKSKI